MLGRSQSYNLGVEQVKTETNLLFIDIFKLFNLDDFLHA